MAREIQWTYGGNGGTPFQALEYPIRSVMIRSWDVVDSISINGSRFGGGGGANSDVLTMGEYDYVTEISGATGYYGKPLVVVSLALHAQNSRVARSYKHTRYGTSSFVHRLPPNQVLVAISGRVGKYLDAISFHVREIDPDLWKCFEAMNTNLIHGVQQRRCMTFLRKYTVSEWLRTKSRVAIQQMQAEAHEIMRGPVISVKTSKSCTTTDDQAIQPYSELTRNTFLAFNSPPVEALEYRHQLVCVSDVSSALVLLNQAVSCYQKIQHHQPDFKGKDSSVKDRWKAILASGGQVVETSNEQLQNFTHLKHTSKQLITQCESLCSLLKAKDLTSARRVMTAVTPIQHVVINLLHGVDRLNNQFCNIVTSEASTLLNQVGPASLASLINSEKELLSKIEKSKDNIRRILHDESAMVSNFANKVQQIIQTDAQRNVNIMLARAATEIIHLYQEIRHCFLQRTNSPSFVDKFKSIIDRLENCANRGIRGSQTDYSQMKEVISEIERIALQLQNRTAKLRDSVSPEHKNSINIYNDSVLGNCVRFYFDLDSKLSNSAYPLLYHVLGVAEKLRRQAFKYLPYIDDYDYANLWEDALNGVRTLSMLDDTELQQARSYFMDNAQKYPNQGTLQNEVTVLQRVMEETDSMLRPHVESINHSARELENTRKQIHAITAMYGQEQGFAARDTLELLVQIHRMSEIVVKVADFLALFVTGLLNVSEGISTANGLIERGLHTLASVNETAQGVKAWLELQGLAKYADKFLAAGVDQIKLMTITHEELKELVGTAVVVNMILKKREEFGKVPVADQDTAWTQVKLGMDNLALLVGKVKDIETISALK